MLRRLIPEGIFLSIACGCAHDQVRSTPPQLTDLHQLDPSLVLDLRYASPNNFTGKVLYPEALALLLKEPAIRLIEAHRKLSAQGLGIVIYDAYRPWSVTQILWQTATPDQRRLGFVADPAQGSMHNRGCAVDVGLYDRKSGQKVEMPSDFDEFSARSFSDYSGGSTAARAHSRLLRTAMESSGFVVLPEEWWHFSFKGCEHEPLLNLDFKGRPFAP